MSKTVFKSISKAGIVGLSLAVLMPNTAFADKTDTIIQSGLERQRAAAKSQKRIDTISEEIDKVISKYQQEKKSVESLKAYNDQLRKTLNAQEVAKLKFQRSIEEASLIERQITPLMTRMISGIEKFISVDMPFKVEERRDRVERIKSYLTNANISAAERFRKVLEAYSIENGYGRSIDVYIDTLSIDNADLTVNILQVGRAAMYYQTTDGAQSGYYDKSSNTWQKLDSSHNDGISNAIKVAQKKVSPDLMLLPLTAPEGI